jgi:hypothetical protein
MWQRHNAQLANFDVPSLRVRASAKTQGTDMAVYFRTRYAAGIPPLKNRFDLCDFASRVSATSGGRDHLTGIKLQLATLFLNSSMQGASALKDRTVEILTAAINRSKNKRYDIQNQSW